MSDKPRRISPSKENTESGRSLNPGKDKTRPNRTRTVQSDLPLFPLKKAVEIAQSIWNEYGGHPTPPIDVAAALKISPTSSSWRYLTGASSAYGLTRGGYSSENIALTDLGQSLFRSDGSYNFDALVEAAFQPSIASTIYNRYLEKRWPDEAIGKNTLRSLGIPEDKLSESWAILHQNGDFVGIIQTVQGNNYLRKSARGEASSSQSSVGSGDKIALGEALEQDDFQNDYPEQPTDGLPKAKETENNRRVFVTHGKNRDLVENIKSFLKLADLEPIVSVQRATAAEPIPEKVLNEMKSCGAAIIHVDEEGEYVDETGASQKKINDNVLIEIGISMALYNKRFILLVRDGVRLPSNLSGLFEVRYGEVVDMTTTLKLVEALQSIKITDRNP